MLGAALFNKKLKLLTRKFALGFALQIALLQTAFHVAQDCVWLIHPIVVAAISWIQ
jgi:hypothetical protein